MIYTTAITLILTMTLTNLGNNFTEGIRDMIDVVMSENPLRGQGGMRKRLVFIKPIEQDDELDLDYYN
jgi:hypothetical protein